MTARSRNLRSFLVRLSRTELEIILYKRDVDKEMEKIIELTDEIEMEEGAQIREEQRAPPSSPSGESAEDSDVDSFNIESTEDSDVQSLNLDVDSEEYDADKSEEEMEVEDVNDNFGDQTGKKNKKIKVVIENLLLKLLIFEIFYIFRLMVTCGDKLSRTSINFQIKERNKNLCFL